MYEPNNRATKHIKLRELREIDNPTTVFRDFNVFLAIVDKTGKHKQKEYKKTEEYKLTI